VFVVFRTVAELTVTSVAERKDSSVRRQAGGVLLAAGDVDDPLVPQALDESGDCPVLKERVKVLDSLVTLVSLD
jgi:hypothetical protein